MYKALITDLDGSAVPLTSMGQHVDEATKQAIKEAQSRGFHISCATGRIWKSAKPVVDALGLKSLCIIEGGTSIIDSRTEQIKWRKLLDQGTEVEVFNIFQQAPKNSWLLVSDEFKPRLLAEVKEIKPDIRFMYLMGLSEEIASGLIKQISLLPTAVAHTTPSWYGRGLVDIHVTHPEATKGHAIKVWHSLEGVSVAETIGMGDSGNDLPLFQASGLKVAVGNATAALKEAADYLAPELTDGALKHVIDKFLLSQK